MFLPKILKERAPVPYRTAMVVGTTEIAADCCLPPPQARYSHYEAVNSNVAVELAVLESRQRQ
eukprot:3156953-Amphidinium_carterae.1